MWMRWMRLGILFACAVGLVGCASSAPEPLGDAPDDASRSVADSTRGTSVGPEPRVSPESHRPESAAPIEALRAAYVDGAYEEVVRRARTALDDSLGSSDQIQLNTLLARAEQARGRHEAAIEALRRARVAASERDQSVVAIDRALGESYVARRRWPQAASAFRRVLEAQPEDRAARQALAEVYRRSRNWDRAREQYAQLVQADSSNGRWWARLAQSALELNAHDQAQREFARAHRLLPRSADVALSLSRLYRANGQLEAAQRVVDTTLSYQSADPRLWRRHADLAFEQDDLDTARRAYRQTAAVGDSSATVLRRVGMIDVRRQEYPQALPFLRTAYQRDSKHPRTTLYLGIVYQKLDSLGQAEAYLQRTIDQVADGPITRAFEHLGATHSQGGEVSGAVEAYKTALRLRPGRTEVYFRLATVYDEHYKEKAPAARYYRRFLETSDASLPELRQYARDRLETLRPTLHMQESPQP
jgi:tetratricopeptide (TPR) repeat protein